MRRGRIPRLVPVLGLVLLAAFAAACGSYRLETPPRSREPRFPLQSPLPHHRRGAAHLPQSARGRAPGLHRRVLEKARSRPRDRGERVQDAVFPADRRGQPPVHGRRGAGLAPGPRPDLHPPRPAERARDLSPGRDVLRRADRDLVLRVFPDRLHRPRAGRAITGWTRTTPIQLADDHEDASSTGSRRSTPDASAPGIRPRGDGPGRRGPRGAAQDPLREDLDEVRGRQGAADDADRRRCSDEDEARGEDRGKLPARLPPGF